MNVSGDNITIASRYSPLMTITLSILVIIMWLFNILGNTLVIVAIILDRRLKGVQNWYLASLAMADLLLGVLIVPLSFTKQILGVWVFGTIVCQFWLVTDVLLCTASIINLSLISLDRYWSITRPIFAQTRTPKQAGISIALVWIVSAIICMPPLFGWNKAQKSKWDCELTNDIGYVLYSTIGSFFIPTTIIVIVYAKIYWEARKRAHFSSGSTARYQSASSSCTNKQTTLGQDKRTAGRYDDRNSELDNNTVVEKEVENDSPSAQEHPLASNGNVKTPESLPTVPPKPDKLLVSDFPVHDSDSFEVSTPSNGPSKATQLVTQESLSPATPRSVPQGRRRPRSLFNYRIRSKRRRPPKTQSQQDHSMIDTVAIKKRKVAKSRERRATIVLGIILGAFIFCWFPFFCTYVIDVFCRCVSMTLFDVFFWIGYCNSAVNPIIYTVFNRDFRSAFQRVLSRCCGCI